MSCTVKIGASKSWSGTQRKINSLAEEDPQSSGTIAQFVVSGPIQGNVKVATSRAIKSVSAKKGEDTHKLIKYIDDNVIGKNVTFIGPFGRRKVVYCDYAASGRSLQFLEDYILKEVLPFLGNTRYLTSISSLQSSLFRNEAREIIKHVVGANEQDALFFTGQGAICALRTLLTSFDFSTPTTVLVGPHDRDEYHRPWRECGAKIVKIKETREGFLDLNDLERKIVNEKSNETASRIIGYFSIANCVTGVLVDDVATTLLLRQHGALSIWNYTSAAPYVKVDMNPHLTGINESKVYKDAIIISGHKFVGGVQTLAVLIVKKALLNEKEEIETNHHLKNTDPCYERSIEGVVEEIRFGLAMQLKENVTPQAIATRHDKISKQVLSHARTIPELILLGSTSSNVKRLPVFSFLVRHPRGMFLHHNFVCAILNDVFGVQAQGGCACADQYAYDLMGINETLSNEYKSSYSKSSDDVEDEAVAEALRPGFTRISFPYFMSEIEVGFVLEALKMVATEGWKLLPQYVLNVQTGEWRHHTNSVFKDRRCLGTIRYTDGKMNAAERRISGAGSFPQAYNDCLQTARNIFNRARKMAQRCPLQVDHVSHEAHFENLRWFMLSNEAQDLLLGNSQNVKTTVPFDPNHSRCVENSGTGNSGGNFVMRRLNSDVPFSGTIPIATLSPRHNSLPVLTCPPDLQNKKRRVIIRMQEAVFQDDCSCATGNLRSPATCPASPSPAVKFALGETVSAAADFFGSTPKSTNHLSVDRHDGIPGRMRCNSLGSSGPLRSRSSGDMISSVPISLSPQTLASLGIATVRSHPRQRHCSCSSQTDLNGFPECERAHSPNRSSSSLGNVPYSSSCSSPFESGSNRIGRSSPVSSIVSQSSEDDLRAYLKEVTKELATEIKSEIREVISKVDDALSETNSCDATPQRLQDKQQLQQQSDSLSATDIAEYLMEFSKGMASEVKSEIRCMVNSVDGLHRYSPDDRTPLDCPSPTEKKRKVLEKSIRSSSSEKCCDFHSDSKVSSECSSDETVISVSKPSLAVENKTTDEEDANEDEDIFKASGKALPKIYSAVNSVSSQDSGINLSFHENDRSVDAEFGRSSSADSNSAGRRFMLSTSSIFNKQTKSADDFSEDEEINFSPRFRGLEEKDKSRQEKGAKSLWHCIPKNIWKSMIEAVQEYDMIRDGDRILLCLSLSSTKSLALLQTLHQFKYYARFKAMELELAVVTIDVDKKLNVDAIKDYMQSIEIPFFYEEIGSFVQMTGHGKEELKVTEPGSCRFCAKAIKLKLYSVAEKNNYNVLAFGHTLDDLTDGFLASVFYNGKLKAFKAHRYVRGKNLRLIRPLVYVRDEALKHFAENKKFPVFRTTSNDLANETQKRLRNEELIAYQEQTHSRLYWSLRSALKPLMTDSMKDPQQSQQHRKTQQLRRLRTDSYASSSGAFSSVQSAEESDETDDEPVL